MSKKKKKNKGNSPSGKTKKAAAEPRPAGRMTIAAVAAAIVVVVLAFGVHLNLRSQHQRCMKLSADVVSQVEALDKARLDGTDLWKRFNNGEVTLPTAVNNLDELVSVAEKAQADIGVLGDSFDVKDSCGFCVRHRNAVEIGEGVKNLLFTLSTEVQFRFFGPIEEGAANMMIAQRLSDDVDKRIHEFRNGEWREGLDLPQKPVADDAEFIFVFLIDTLRADHLSAYGYSRETTPNIDKLASEGLLFENAFSQCSTTDTSVASLLTATYPRTHKMVGSSDWLYEYMLIDNFRKAGYVTGGFSANSLISKETHFDSGFDYFEEMFWGRATVTIGQAQRWIEKVRTDNKKVFAYIHLMDPHDLYFPPPKFLGQFGATTKIGLTGFGLRKLIEEHLLEVAQKDPECNYNPYLENPADPKKLLACLSKWNPTADYTEQDMVAMVARYDAEIFYADHEVGKFVDYLKKNGMLEKSTIVILADHGESFLDHNQAKHGRVLYDNEIHVPLVYWRGRDNFGGRREAGPVEIVDTLPTLMGMAGIEPPPGLHGRDLLNSKPSDDPDKLYSLSWNGTDIFTNEAIELTMVREYPFKYIRWIRRKNATVYRDEFYNLQVDPGESLDARQQYPEVFSRLQENLDWWNKATDSKPTRELKKGADKSKLKKLHDLGYMND